MQDIIMKCHPLQQRMALGAMPMQCQKIDDGDLTAGVRHLGRNLARAVRWNAPMPGNLKPELAGQPLAVQIATLWHAYATFSGRRVVGDDDEALRDRFRLLCRIYEDLALAGYRLNQVENLRERHVKALLEYWRQKKVGVATIRVRWSVLRVWLLALGRPGMVGPLEQYWPGIPAAGRKNGVKLGENPREKRLSQEQMTELMRATDPTHWYIERLRELGLTVEEALRFDQALAANCLQGRLVLRSGVTGQYRTVEIIGQEAVVLVQDVQEFMAAKGRKRLMWQDMTPAAALKRHQNRLSYIRAKTAEAGEPAAAEGAGDA